MLALLDNRITKTRYGQIFFDSLPPYGFTTKREDVESFFRVMFEVSVEQTFAAGHALRNYKGKCENVHGHNFRVQVTIEGERLDETGMLVDFIDVKKTDARGDRAAGSPVPERSSAVRREESVSGEHRRVFL